MKGGKFSWTPVLVLVVTVTSLTASSDPPPPKVLLQCTSGEYISGDSCLKCPAGRYTTSWETHECTACEHGKFQPVDGSDHCDACADGHFADGTGYTACHEERCSAGKYRSDQGSDCEACPGGKYQPSEGQSTCLSCAPGKHSVNALYCSNVCPSVGMFVSRRPETFGECVFCPKKDDYYKENGKIVCDWQPYSCALGMYHPSPDTCEDCPAGYYADKHDASECTKCTDGYLQFLPGQMTCQTNDCPAGKYAESQFRCNLCPAGKFGDTPTTECTTCPAGKYQFQSGNQDCVISTCPPGYKQTRGGCQQCSANTYQPSSGKDLCFSCAAGTEAPPGSSSCSTVTTMPSPSPTSFPTVAPTPKPTFPHASKCTILTCEYDGHHVKVMHELAVEELHTDKHHMCKYDKRFQVCECRCISDAGYEFLQNEKRKETEEASAVHWDLMWPDNSRSPIHMISPVTEEDEAN